MTTLSPSAVQLLADLAEHGIDVQAHGNAIRYRPRHAMTPALLQRLQAHKAELLTLAIIQEAHDPGNADLANCLPFGFPSDAVVVVMDKDGYTDGNMKGEPYMWTWIGGPTWLYVKDYPIPAFGKGNAMKRKSFSILDIVTISR
jgi:hypothetical protein